MSQDQRQSIRFGRTDVQEVELLAINDGGELGQLVDLALGGTPVIAAAPVVSQLVQPRHRYSGVPVITGKRLRPTRLIKPPMKVIDLGPANVETKRADLLGSVHSTTLETA
jgi:hypothetical protein